MVESVRNSSRCVLLHSCDAHCKILEQENKPLSLCGAHSPERAIKFNLWCIRNEEVMCAKESLYTHQARERGGGIKISIIPRARPTHPVYKTEGDACCDHYY